MSKPASYTHLSDDELLSFYRNSNDNQWLGILLERYTLLLLGVAIKYLKDKELAQDAVQHVFLKTLTSLPTDHIHNIKGWLYTILRNYCLQYLRDHKYPAPESALQYLEAEHSDTAAIRLQDYTLDQLEASVDELNTEQRICIAAFYLKQKSYQQIIEENGYTFAQVKSHIQNGKRNLKIILLKKMNIRR